MIVVLFSLFLVIVILLIVIVVFVEALLLTYWLDVVELHVTWLHEPCFTFARRSSTNPNGRRPFIERFFKFSTRYVWVYMCILFIYTCLCSYGWKLLRKNCKLETFLILHDIRAIPLCCHCLCMCKENSFLVASVLASGLVCEWWSLIHHWPLAKG